jgi:hypothetical protein
MIAYIAPSLGGFVGGFVGYILATYVARWALRVRARRIQQARFRDAIRRLEELDAEWRAGMGGGDDG